VDGIASAIAPGIAGVTVALDASTYQGSVAVLQDGRLVAERTVAMRGEHEERLMPAVADALTSIHLTPGDIRRLVCGTGPGSFTSLRIAAAIAKGLATATQAPLYAVSSLALAAVEAGEGRWLVSLDAMRGDVYVAGYAWNGRVLAPLRPLAIVADRAAPAIAATINAMPVEGTPHARGVAALLSAVVAAGPVELAAWEPVYGRLAEAQVKWEAAHGTPLTAL
jgi:tRNA threonylcarbamoyladenosine biosynthesis protein TsaB